jgi:hypothetical protein
MLIDLNIYLEIREIICDQMKYKVKRINQKSSNSSKIITTNITNNITQGTRGNVVINCGKSTAHGDNHKQLS